MKDWRELLYGRWDTVRSKQLPAYLASDPESFEEVFNNFCNGEGQNAHRSGFVLGQIFRKHPHLFIPRMETLMKKMKDPPHEWYRWHVLWFLSHTDFASKYDGAAATYAFEELGKSYAKPALKNASMRLLEFICKRNPGLIPEFKLHLMDIIGNERPTLAAKAKKQLDVLANYEK